MKEPAFPLTVLYDGGCIVCATEMEHYRKKDGNGRLLFVDISAPDFDPAPFGLTLADCLTQLHAIARDGTVFRAVDAFRAIWQAFPSSTLYGLLGVAVALPGVTPLARLCYALFARYRGILPRRRPRCDRHHPPGCGSPRTRE